METDIDLNAERADISQLDAYSEKLGDYINQKGWDKKFKLKKYKKILDLYTNFKLKISSIKHALKQINPS